MLWVPAPGSGTRPRTPTRLRSASRASSPRSAPADHNRRVSPAAAAALAGVRSAVQHAKGCGMCGTPREISQLQAIDGLTSSPSVAQYWPAGHGVQSAEPTSPAEPPYELVGQGNSAPCSVRFGQNEPCKSRTAGIQLLRLQRRMHSCRAASHHTRRGRSAARPKRWPTTPVHSACTSSLWSVTAHLRAEVRRVVGRSDRAEEPGRAPDTTRLRTKTPSAYSCSHEPSPLQAAAVSDRGPPGRSRSGTTRPSTRAGARCRSGSGSRPRRRRQPERSRSGRAGSSTRPHRTQSARATRRPRSTAPQPEVIRAASSAASPHLLHGL